MDIVTILVLTSIICKCIVFSKHQIKWYKALIPGYNKYLIGKFIEKKKLGLVNAILIPLTKIYLFLCYGFELWIIDKYAVSVQIPATETTKAMTRIEVYVPKNIADAAIISKYILLGLVFIAIIFWSIMMYKFTRKHNKTGWWIVLWAFVPAIPFLYFAISSTTIVDGKIVKIKKVIEYD